MPEPTVQTPDEPGGLTARPTRPSIGVDLQRVTPDQVHVVDLSRADKEATHDLVTLDLGTHRAKVSVLGTAEEITRILRAAVEGMAAVEQARREGRS